MQIVVMAAKSAVAVTFISVEIILGCDFEVIIVLLSVVFVDIGLPHFFTD